MLTTTDIDLLKTVFATKDELQNYVTKDYLSKEFEKHTEMIMAAFKSVIDMIGDVQTNVNNRMDQMEAKFDKKFERVDYQLEEMGKRQDLILAELRNNRIVLGNHEQRLQLLEQSSA